MKSAIGSQAPSSLRSAGALQNRREFLAQAVVAPAVIAGISTITSAAVGQIIIDSPNGRIKFHLAPHQDRLRYFVTLSNQRAIDWSTLQISIDGTDITQLSKIDKIERYRIHEEYATRSVHSWAGNSCNGARVSIVHQ